jgi:DNA-binding NtrC family response regulator
LGGELKREVYKLSKYNLRNGYLLENKFTILIADRNRHVREFLKREMMGEGYHILLAKSGREVLKWIYHHEPLDLLILDPDLPDVSELTLVERLEDRIPTLPIVVHAFLSDYTHHPLVLKTTAFVEKRGNSIENLKKVVIEMLRKSYPHKFNAIKDN